MSTVETVITPSVTLHVFDVDDDHETQQQPVEIAVIDNLHRLNRNQLHAVMQRFQFEAKSEAELHSEDRARELKRRKRSFQKFRTQEYNRQCEMHSAWFRRDVLQMDPYATTWYGRDWLWDSYDRINRKFAVTKEERWEHAVAYLGQHDGGDGSGGRRRGRGRML